MRRSTAAPAGSAGSSSPAAGPSEDAVSTGCWAGSGLTGTSRTAGGSPFRRPFAERRRGPRCALPRERSSSNGMTLASAMSAALLIRRRLESSEGWSGGRPRSVRQARRHPVHGPGDRIRRQQPGPRLRAKSANASAVVNFGSKPSVSRICVGAHHPAVRQQAGSARARSPSHRPYAAPNRTQVTAGSSSGSVGRPSRREHCESSSTPSPAMLKVPLLSVPRAVARAPRSAARRSRRPRGRTAAAGRSRRRSAARAARSTRPAGSPRRARGCSRSAARTRRRRAGDGRSRVRTPRPRPRPSRSRRSGSDLGGVVSVKTAGSRGAAP